MLRYTLYVRARRFISPVPQFWDGADRSCTAPIYCHCSVAFSTILCTFQLSPPIPPPNPVCSRTLLTSPPRNPPAGSGMCTVWSVQLPRVRPPLTLFTGIDRPLFSSMITSQLSPAGGLRGGRSEEHTSELQSPDH